MTQGSAMAAARLDDADLVALHKAGERSAFDEIVRRYQDRVFSIALRWMGDRAVAEDVAQDVFVAAYRALHGFRGDSQLSTWLHRVAINQCKNRRLYRARRQLDQHAPLDAPEGPTRHLPSEAPRPDASTHRREAHAHIWEALAKLDEDERALIILRDIQGLDYEAIAELLEVPRGTVKSRLHRARGHLAGVLARTLNPDDVW